jgi:hypothetical protein
VATGRGGNDAPSGGSGFTPRTAITATSSPTICGIGSRIELPMRQEEDPRLGCSHAMAVQGSVIAEARVCLLNKDTDPAVNSLLDQIVAKIPQ